MKFLTVATVFLINVVSAALAVYIHTPNSESGNVKPVVPPESIYSDHIPRFLVPLNLTTGELKLFAGHSFQLIKAKCPAVSQDRLNLINKYITKLISRNPVPGSSPDFKVLVSSITTCTQHQITEEEKSKRHSSFFQYFFNPLRSLRNLLSVSDSPSAPSPDPISLTKNTAEKSSILVEVSSTVAPPDTVPLNVEADPVESLIPYAKEDNKISLLTATDDDSEAFAIPSLTDRPDEIIATTGLPSDVKQNNDGQQQDSTIIPSIRIFYTTGGGSNSDTEETVSPWNPMGWLGGVFRAIQSFFFRLFDAPAPSPVPNAEPSTYADPMNPVPKVKRDVSTDQVELQEVRTMETDAPVATVKGKDAFMVLVDNMCRIYCNECLDRDQIRNYKAAAKELLQFILTDSTGIELAAKHFLEPDFLQSLNDC